MSELIKARVKPTCVGHRHPDLGVLSEGTVYEVRPCECRPRGAFDAVETIKNKKYKPPAVVKSVDKEVD